ncbi:hypothetical protein Ciccas_003722 [Cichlidogyrus casuarinus]|uniref:Endonuclease V n=1 Tax=Cichlidogyrus casuarinus TaxID=1844966 RepID=A0ABD2QEG7_9PLAT
MSGKSAQWIQEQLELKKHCILQPTAQIIQKVEEQSLKVGGVDISFFKDDETRAIACLVVISYSDLSVLASHWVEVTLNEPYIPHFLAFRECPAFKQLITSFKEKYSQELYPDLLIVDGNGTLHPRSFGSACHIGVELNIPTIGVAKNLLIWNETDDRKTIIEAAKRALEQQQTVNLGDYGQIVILGKQTKRPMFVSPGHLIDAKLAVEIASKVSIHRIPEPIRQADLLSRQVVRRSHPISP